MYDMYPWDTASQGDYPPSPLRSRRGPSAGPGGQNGRAGQNGQSGRAGQNGQNGQGSQADRGSQGSAEPPARAVQFALDRRDNEGEASPAPAVPARQARQ